MKRIMNYELRITNVKEWVNALILGMVVTGGVVAAVECWRLALGM